MKTALELNRITQEHISVKKYIEDYENTVNQITTKEILRIHKILDIISIKEYYCILEYPKIDFAMHQRSVGERVTNNVFKHFIDWGYEILDVNNKDYTISWVNVK